MLGRAAVSMLNACFREAIVVLYAINLMSQDSLECFDYISAGIASHLRSLSYQLSPDIKDRFDLAWPDGRGDGPIWLHRLILS